MRIFMLKLSYKNSCVKFDAFSKRNSLFFLKNEALWSKSGNAKPDKKYPGRTLILVAYHTIQGHMTIKSYEAGAKKAIGTARTRALPSWYNKIYKFIRTID